ncbi:hypothetical protein SEUCBS140593_006641 [Sporothrix eucalyptigena]|uniref:FAS1 domain-containing protein n=1 Tax=Sporothrix eucalyptigena TaxID=1812306 RepID=A0ABP0C6I9_9PEZI
MKLLPVALASLCVAVVHGAVSDRTPLSYAPVPADVYVPTNAAGTMTLLELVQSRDDLSLLAEVVAGSAGFLQSFNTTPEWSFTFFAPSNTAFNNTGSYYSTFASRPKGKWWLGNLLQHHYVPFSTLLMSDFSTTVQRLQTSTYLYVSTQLQGGQLVLNNVSVVTEGNIPVTNGVVHIIDHILDPAAQIFEAQYPSAKQAFIAGSCSNPSLPYC